jgi:hypothetical protein
MSRYENLINQQEQLEKCSFIKDISIHPNDNEEQSSSDEQITSINQQSTDSLDYHSTEDNEQNNSKSTSLFDRIKSFVTKPIEIVQEVIENRFNTDVLPTQQQQQHFQSAYDLHDEEKSKLVRSPELYNMDNVIKHNHRSLLTNSQIQYRTLSESALGTDESKHHNLTTSHETSAEFLTTISKENSLEFNQAQQQRLSTPFDDVLEKESSPEHSESYNIPISAFSDAFEPTSSCQRPLAFGQHRNPTEIEYETVANDLVNQILIDVIIELNDEQDDDSLLSNKSDKLSASSSTSSYDNYELREEDEDEALINNDQSITTTRSSFSKILRRAQTDIKHFNIVQSPIALIPPIIRRNSQSDTEKYFRAVSPSVQDYIKIDNNSSSDEKSSDKTRYLLLKENEKYSGEGEESSGGKERTIQRRKRSNDVSNSYESPSIKNVSFKFETNENMIRQESLDSPLRDSNEKLILKILQETIFRTNLETSQIDLKLTNQQNEIFQEKTYSSTTKKFLSYYDYDGGSETDRDDLKIHHKLPSSSIDINIKNLLNDLIDTVNDDLSISSQSDANTVIFNSNKTSLDVEENLQTDKYFLSILTSSSSSSSPPSSHSVIYNEQNFTSFINQNPKKQSSIPSFSNTELIEHNTKKKFRSYPGSLVPITSTTTSNTFQSGN